MRELTKQEMEVLNHLRDAVYLFLDMPEFHEADKPEFVVHIHGLQNIVMSRPAMEWFVQLDEEESEDGE